MPPVMNFVRGDEYRRQLLERQKAKARSTPAQPTATQSSIESTDPTCTECGGPARFKGSMCTPCWRKSQEIYDCSTEGCMNKSFQEGRMCPSCWTANSQECLNCHKYRTTHASSVCGGCRPALGCGICGSCDLCLRLGYDKLNRCYKCGVALFDNHRFCKPCWEGFDVCMRCNVSKVFGDGQYCQACLCKNCNAPIDVEMRTDVCRKCYLISRGLKACRKCNELTSNRGGFCNNCAEPQPCKTKFTQNGKELPCSGKSLDGTYCGHCKEARKKVVTARTVVQQ